MKGLFHIVVAVLLAGCSSMRTGIPAGKTDRSSFDVRYEYYLAEALRQKYVGEINQAAELFEKCIQLDRSRAVPYYELAQMYAAADIGNRAIEYGTRAARLEPGNHWYQMAAGSLFMQYGVRDSAIVYFKRALVADPQSASVKGILTMLYSEEGDYQRVDSLLAEIDREGQLTENLLMRYILRLMTREEYGKAAEKAMSLLEQEPGEIRYRALLADIWNRAGERHKSDSIYDKIVEENPDNVVYLLTGMVNRKEYEEIAGFLETIFTSGVLTREQKLETAKSFAEDTAFIGQNLDSFLRSLDILEKLFPDDGGAFSIRPIAYETAGKLQEAIALYEDLIERGFKGFWFRERLMVLYAGKSDYEKLYSLSSQYSRENNMSLPAKVYYGLSAMELKKYDVAEAEFRKALILAGNDPELKGNILAFTGDLKYRMNEVDAACKLYEEAYKLNPDDNVVLNNYAYFLAEAGRDLKLALQMIQKVVAEEADNNTYADTYAWVLFKLKRVKEAYAVMQRIFENGKEISAEHFEHMGYIKKALKKCDEAVIYWQHALDEDGTKEYLQNEIRKCVK